MPSALLETQLSRCLSPEWIRRILHIIAVTGDTPITVEDMQLVEKVWEYASKAVVSVDDCWFLLETVLHDNSILERMLKTATLITLLSMAQNNPNQRLEWRRIVDHALGAPQCIVKERKECYRQRLVVICPMLIYSMWMDSFRDMDCVQRVYSMMDVLEREDLRLILRQVLLRVSKSSEKRLTIEPFEWVTKTKTWLGNALQLRVNQFSEGKLLSYHTMTDFLKLAIWSPQHTLYQICNSAVLRKGDLTKYVSLVKELDQVASFSLKAPCLLMQWIEQIVRVVVVEEEYVDRHLWIPCQVSVEALLEWIRYLMEATTRPLLDPLHFIYYVLVLLPNVENWISERVYGKLEIVASLLEIVGKILLEYYRCEIYEWGLQYEEKYFMEDNIFDWLRNIYEKRWLLTFSLRRQFVDFVYTFLELPRKQHRDTNDYWNRWISKTSCYSTRILLYCLYSKYYLSKLRIPYTFDNNYPWSVHTLTYLYLRELITIGEISIDLGQQAWLCFYEAATKCQSNIEKELVQVEIPYCIAQWICDWESSEQLWYLVLLQKCVYLSSSELERLTCGLLMSAVDCNLWKDSLQPWINCIYEENPFLLSSRKDVMAYIIIGKLFVKLVQCYYRIDPTVLLLTEHDDWIERKCAVQMVSSLIQTFQRKINTAMTARICFSFELLVEATRVYSDLWNEIEKDEESLELWDMLLLGLGADMLHTEIGEILLVPFLQNTPDWKNNKLKQQLERRLHRESLMDRMRT